MNGPNEDETDLPKPETEPIRNFAGLPKRIRDAIPEGLFLALEGLAVQENAVKLGTLYGLLEHFDKLFRVVQADRCGVEVRRRGRLADVAGGRELEALPSAVGSYALPLRLSPPEGQIVGSDYKELEALMDLLNPETDLGETLQELPERVGDELHELFHVIASGGTDLRVEIVRDGTSTAEVQIGADQAQTRAAWLSEETEHDLGTGTLRGKLFRIDTKKYEVRVDVLQEDGDSSTEKASFEPHQFETLRDALDQQVEIEVGIAEDRRPYERAATSRKLRVVSIRRIEDDEDQ